MYDQLDYRLPNKRPVTRAFPFFIQSITNLVLTYQISMSTIFGIVIPKGDSHE